jgi:hypothetical protein
MTRVLQLIPRPLRCPEDQLEAARQLRRNGEMTDAFEALKRCFRQYPHDPHVWHEQALYFIAANEFGRAEGILRTVIEAMPRSPQPYMQLGTLLERSGDYMGSLSFYRKAIRAHQDRRDGRGLVICWAGMANNNYRLGKPLEGWEWVKRIRTAVKQDGLTFGDQIVALDAHARFVAGLQLMAAREWARGWALYEARHELHEHRLSSRLHGVRADTLPVRRWDGASRGSVVVLPEQGAGDVLMMSRYLNTVAERSGERVWAIVHPELVPLLRQKDGRVWPVSAKEWNAGGPDVGFYVEIMSLPHVLGLPEPIEPTHLPRFHWTEQPLRQRKRVGICWHGSRDHANDKDRSAPTREILAQRLEDRGWQVVSLQAGEDGFFPRDFAETAQTMLTLDAVLTVDTSVAHLAGTVGVPTVVIPPTPIDWRWPIIPHENGTPWYPSIRVVRRASTTDWDDAAARACDALRELMHLPSVSIA